MKKSIEDIVNFSSDYKKNPLYIEEDETVKLSIKQVIWFFLLLFILTFVSIYPDLKEGSQGKEDFNLQSEYKTLVNLLNKE